MEKKILLFLLIVAIYIIAIMSMEIYRQDTAKKALAEQLNEARNQIEQLEESNRTMNDALKALKIEI